MGTRSVASLGLAIGLVASPAPAQDRTPLRVVAERPVPAPVVWALDVRWATDESVLIAAGRDGVFEVSTADAAGPPRAAVPGAGSGGPWNSSQLGVSASHLVIGAPVFSLSWSRRPELDLRVEPFDAIVDVDLAADRLLVLGGVKDGDGRFSPDGAMAWLGAVDGGRRGLRPILYSRHGAGSRAMAECGILGLGAVRFLPDGSFVVVPGVEPGIFLYSRDGELRRTWENREVALEDECSPVLGRTEALAADPVARRRWLDRRVIVDEVLPLPDGGAGLVLRRVEDGVTRWRLAVLGDDGGVGWYELPVTSSTGWSHLRGDVRGRRVVLLVVEHGAEIEKPAAPPRLVVAEWTP